MTLKDKYEKVILVANLPYYITTQIIEKVLKSAIANAVNNNELDENNLYVADVVANQGPTLKRIRPRAQGRAYRINKKTAHISIYLDEKK